MIFCSVTRFTLLLAQRAAVLIQGCGQQIEKTWILQYSDPSFHKTLFDALKRHPYYPLKIVVDGAETNIHMDDLPPVTPWTRKTIVARQGKHHFPKSYLETSQGYRDAAGRKWMAHHVACGEEGALTSIFEKMQDVLNPIEPLSLFPIEWPGYAGQVTVGAQKGWSFANVLGESFGLRQLVIKDGRVVFTRSHTDCYPSLDKAELAGRMAAHIRATLDYLPRLDANIPQDIPVRLYVPGFLMNLNEDAALNDLKAQIIAIAPPKGELIPEAWAADIAWLSVAARQKHAAMPVEPLWLKQLRDGTMKKQIALWVLIFFGSAGIYSGMSILTQIDQGQPAQVQPLLSSEPLKPVTEAQPPELKLEAVLYNSPQDWAVWINGEKHVPGEKKNHLTMTGVSPQNVQVRWQDGKVEKQYSLNLISSASEVITH